MANPRLLLHIGPHKTGTTAIQNKLRECDDELEAHGWHVEKFSGLPGNAHYLADLLSFNQMEAAEPYLDRLRNITRPTIVSSENFSRFNSKQVAQLLSATGLTDLRIVYYLRNPLHRLASAWRERVKHGYRHTFVEFIAGRLLTPFKDGEINDQIKIAPWSEAIRADTTASSAFDLHLYDQIDNVTQHFFETYLHGLTTHTQSNKARTNVSPNLTKTEVMRALSGYQVHLQKHRDYDDNMSALVDAVDTVLNEHTGRYVRQLSFSLDNPVVRSLERQLISANASSIQHPLNDDMLYQDRRTSWDYIAAEIWLENPHLTQMIFDLRSRMHEDLGAPVFDQRLSAL